MHNVKFNIPERELGRADVEFDISDDVSKIGRLKVSKGGVEWVRKDHSLGYKLNWNLFDEVMRQRGTRA